MLETGGIPDGGKGIELWGCISIPILASLPKPGQDEKQSLRLSFALTMENNILQAETQVHWWF